MTHQWPNWHDHLLQHAITHENHHLDPMLQITHSHMLIYTATAFHTPPSTTTHQQDISSTPSIFTWHRHSTIHPDDNDYLSLRLTKLDTYYYHAPDNTWHHFPYLPTNDAHVTLANLPTTSHFNKHHVLGHNPPSARTIPQPYPREQYRRRNIDLLAETISTTQRTYLYFCTTTDYHPFHAPTDNDEYLPILLLLPDHRPGTLSNHVYQLHNFIIQRHLLISNHYKTHAMHIPTPHLTMQHVPFHHIHKVAADINEHLITNPPPQEEQEE